MICILNFNFPSREEPIEPEEGEESMLASLSRRFLFVGKAGEILPLNWDADSARRHHLKLGSSIPLKCLHVCIKLSIDWRKSSSDLFKIIILWSVFWILISLPEKNQSNQKRVRSQYILTYLSTRSIVHALPLIVTWRSAVVIGLKIGEYKSHYPDVAQTSLSFNTYVAGNLLKIKKTGKMKHVFNKDKTRSIILKR